MSPSGASLPNRVNVMRRGQTNQWCRAAGLVAVFVLAGLGAIPDVAGAVEIQIRLPVKARLDLEDRKSVTVLPFMVVSGEGEESAIHRGVDIQKEVKAALPAPYRNASTNRQIEKLAARILIARVNFKQQRERVKP